MIRLHLSIHYPMRILFFIPLLAVGCLTAPKRSIEIDSDRIDMSVDQDVNDMSVDQDVNDMSADQDLNDMSADQNVNDMSIDLGEIDMDNPEETIACEIGSMPVPCGHFRTELKGLCAEALSYCEDGFWTSCEFRDLRENSNLETYIGDELSDCFDNDCDGQVDEGLMTHPAISKWDEIIVDSIQRHCHYRPYELDGELINEVLLRPDRDHYNLGSLTIHDGMTVKIKKQVEWVEGTQEQDQSQTPGFRSLITATTNLEPCMVDKVGGQLILTVANLIIEDGGALRADSESIPCEVTDENDRSQSINGASGGDLRLYAGTAEIFGEISANGAPPQPVYYMDNEYYSDHLSGGAAGSVVIVTPESSRQGELPPPPLTEPYVKLSLHTALMIRASV